MSGETSLADDELGPIDYVLVEFPGNQMTGEGLPLLVDLVERGIIRILDLVFMSKGSDGTVARLELDALDGVAELQLFDGVASGLLGDDDLTEAAAALDPNSSAALIVYENSWAGPFAAAVRRGGGQLVAYGRIPTEALLDTLDALDAAAQG
jgi:hypothetical protein